MPKLAELIASQIRADIQTAGWRAGAHFGSEFELLQRYGVSRAVLREAIRLLEHHGVAEMRRGRGLIVTKPTSDAVARAMATYFQYEGVQLRHLLDARMALEVYSVDYLVKNMTEEKIAQLRDHLECERNAANDSVDLSQRFHILIAELTGNPVLGVTVRSLSVLARLQTRRRLNAEEARVVHAVHTDIADAIISGDSALAQYRMRDHLEATWHLVPDHDWLQTTDPITDPINGNFPSDSCA